MTDMYINLILTIAPAIPILQIKKMRPKIFHGKNHD